MFRRRAERPVHDPSGTALGVGVQVYVTERTPATGEDWPGEPTGVIVAPGDRGLRSVGLPPDGLTRWIVAFSEPQRTRDGRGPFERAAIPAALLVAAEPVADEPAGDLAAGEWE
ncbi:hypothetical protein [Leifsonia sp. NPDC080035]|uniref:Uncharacterized protein n=1 Tax=Leifsonia sp. NPDC080035 TaxID=3143936 RepID=A0AAU7GAP9_9MICO